MAPYDARSFRRAMRDGIDPAGNVLEPAMPRYDLDDADLDALVAYLKRLDAQRDPGITDTTLRIGTVLPTSGRLADTGRAVQRVLQGYFDGINQKRRRPWPAPAAVRRRRWATKRATRARPSSAC